MHDDSAGYEQALSGIRQILDLMDSDPSGVTLGVSRWKVEMARERLRKALDDLVRDMRPIPEKCWDIASHLRVIFKYFSEYGDVDQTSPLIQKMLEVHDLSTKLSGR